MVKICVYTCIFGRYDQLRSHVSQSIPVDFLCFTDDPTLQHHQYRVIVDDPLPRANLDIPSAHQNIIRVCLYRTDLRLISQLRDYDICIYVDANVEIKDPHLIRSMIMDGENYDLIISRHPWRTTWQQELEVCRKIPKYSNNDFDRQMIDYSNTITPDLMWNGFVVHRYPWEKRMNSYYDLYTQHMCQYFKNPHIPFHPQGQVVLPFVLSQSVVKVKLIPNIYTSPKIRFYSHQPKPKMLLMDYLFPAPYGHWRTNEINYLLANSILDIDILVSLMKYVEKLGNSIESIFKSYLSQYPYLRNYHVIVFNKKYEKCNFGLPTHLSLGSYPADFLLTKHPQINWASYKIGYCIFLDVRYEHHKMINANKWPVVTKIYPSGGFSLDHKRHHSNFEHMNKRGESVITTQPYITDAVSPFIEQTISVHGIPILPSNFVPKYKQKGNRQLNIGFMSLEDIPRKGFADFKNLADSLHHRSEFHFHVIGVQKDVYQDKNITYHGILDGDKVDDVMKNTIDVIVAPIKMDRFPDGFPMNSEAMIAGCLPIQTDPHNVASHYHFSPEWSCILGPDWNPTAVVEFLDRMLDPEIREVASRNLINHVTTILSAKNQLEPILKHLESRI